MTQAIPKQLNILNDRNMQKYEPAILGMDNTNNFSKIFDNKTQNYQKKQNEVDETVHNDLDEENKEKSILSKVVKDAASDLLLDFAIVQEDKIIPNEVDLNVSEEISDEMPIINEENTITNEDSTMNKETIYSMPPENPLTALISILSKNNEQPQETDEAVSLKKVENAFEKTDARDLHFKNYKDTYRELLESDKKVLETDDNIRKSDDTSLSDIVDENILEELNIEAIEAEAGSQQNQTDLMNSQTLEEHGIKTVINAEVKFDDVASKILSSSKTQSVNINPGKILDQISKQLEGMYNNSKVNIVLNPETLGRISLQLVNSKDGLVAQFTVTNQDVRDIIAKGLAGLKESLLAHGVSVDNVTVKLSDSGDSEYSHDWTDSEGSRGAYKEQGSKHHKEDKKQFEQMMFEIENNDNV